MKLLSPVDKVDEVDKLIQAGDFQYQARSWEYPLRVMVRVEWHWGQLFPRVGFVVTNLFAKPKGVVHFYNRYGTAEPVD